MPRFSLLLPSVLLILVSGCGFHLRDRLILPKDTATVRVESVQPYSELVKLLQRRLQATGAEVIADNNQPLPALDQRPDFARLSIHAERWGELPTAIDSSGRAQEYRLRYAVIFSFILPDGSVLVPQQAIELSRDYISQPTDATGTSTERELLANELRREMAASILRRVDSVARAQTAAQP